MLGVAQRKNLFAPSAHLTFPLFPREKSGGKGKRVGTGRISSLAPARLWRYTPKVYFFRGQVWEYISARGKQGKVFWHKNSGARLCCRRGAIHYEPKEEKEEEEEGKTLPPPFFPAKREAKEEDCTVVCWRLFWSAHEPTQAFTTFFFLVQN